MKMAKASEADLDMAMELISVLDDIESGYFPGRFGDPESESSERIDTYDRQQYDRLIDNLRRLLNRGSIGRVIMGMAVVCDPSNECIDPDADTIEHHPKRQQMEAALKDLEAKVIDQQARIEQLLEAVEYCCSQVQEFITVPGISKALSTPADLSALRAHDAAIWREAMQIAEDSRNKATMSKYSSVPECRAARDMAECLSKAYCHKADAIEKGGE